jgi:hypothetical protein
MKQRIFSLISIVLGIVFALALIEVAAIAWLYVEDGRYTPAAELFERTHNTYVRDTTKKGTACRYVDDNRIAGPVIMATLFFGAEEYRKSRSKPSSA